MADMVTVVSAESSVAELQQHELINIFLGKTQRLSDGTQVVPIDLREGSPLREEFYRRYAGKSPAQMKSYWSRMIFTGRGRPPKSLSDSLEIKRWLAVQPRAIGYIDRALVDTTVKVVRIR